MGPDGGSSEPLEPPLNPPLRIDVDDKMILGARFEHDDVTIKGDRKRMAGTEPDMQAESNRRTT